MNEGVIRPDNSPLSYAFKCISQDQQGAERTQLMTVEALARSWTRGVRQRQEVLAN